MSYEIRFVRIPGKDLAVVRSRTTPDRIPEVMPQSFEDVAAYLVPRGLLGNGPAVAVYTGMDADGFAVAAGFVVERPIVGDGHVEPLALPGAEIVTTTHLGPYDTLPAAYEALQRAAAEQGRELGPVMWEEYWSPPDTPAAETRTVICWPVAPAR